MTQYSPLFLRLFVLAVGWLSISGCQSDGRWSQWRDREESLLATGPEGRFGFRNWLESDTDSAEELEPDQAAGPEVFNKHYNPYVEEPTDPEGGFRPPSSPLPQERHRFDRSTPPLVPPSRSDARLSGPDGRGSDLRLPTSSVSERLIKVLQSPRRLFPGTGRGIYDRLRPQEDDEKHEPTIPPKDGPIAQLPTRERTTQVCQYNKPYRPAVCPVTLGLPEPIDGPLLSQSNGFNAEMADRNSPQPVIMQATPSSFKHPLLADPTGLPYQPLSDL